MCFVGDAGLGFVGGGEVALQDLVDYGVSGAFVGGFAFDGAAYEVPLVLRRVG